MPDNSTDDDDQSSRPSPRRDEPDAHGQAALLLVESVLHTLQETGILTLDQAIDVVRTASEVKVEVANETGESRVRMQQSINLLAAIEQSLKVDGAGGDARPDPVRLI